MNTVGISTDIGLNYGSLLQAFATKEILSKIGYESDVFHLKGSIVKGRDVRLSKLIIMALRMVLYSKNYSKTFKQYRESFVKELGVDTINSLTSFIKNQLDVLDIKYSDLKRRAKTDDYIAFLCGSDQIWITDSFYVDPFYYLSYAPKHKRIAFAPSFGRDFVPEYNKKAISKKISDILYLSVRESSGKKIIEELTGRDSKVLLDPSLGLSRDEWSKYMTEKTDYKDYLLAYFLDEPSEETVSRIKELAHNNNLKIVAFPYNFSKKYADIFDSNIGPFDFVGLINQAKIVCTDSFHGTAFSLNFGTPFYTFERNYGSSLNQSTRIKSLLELTKTEDRYCKDGQITDSQIDFKEVEKILGEKRVEIIDYLENSIKGVLEYENK